MQKKCLLTVCLICMFGIVGCQDVTKEVKNNDDKSIVTMEERTKKQNITTCNIYELEKKSVNNDIILKDFIQDKKQYEVIDYLNADEHNTVETYEATGEQIKNTNWKKYSQAYTLGDGTIKVCEETTLAEETLSIYDWDVNKYFPQQLWVYQTAVGMNLGNQISYSGFLKNEWKNQELKFQQIDQTKEKVIDFLKKYGVEIGNEMEIYGIHKNDILEYHRNIHGSKNKVIDTSYCKDGYFIFAYIQKDGISVISDLNATENEDATSRKLPSIELYYTDQGVDYVRVENYQTCTKKIETKEVIDYDKAKNEVLKQFKGVSYTGRERYVLDAGKLVYLPEQKKDKIITKPIWSFSGKKYDDEAGNGYYTDILYMVDACSGKLIR